ncbi:MAG: ADP-ribosylation factor-like protein [Candidatus Heimdallarchaeota archaeon]
MYNSFKVIIAGSDASRRKQLVEQYGTDRLDSSDYPILGVEFANKTTTFKDKGVKLILWSFVNAPFVHPLLPHYFEGAKGAVLLFDVGDLQSFEESKEWLKRFNQNNLKIPVILVDYRSNQSVDREVPEDDVQSFVDENNLVYFEISIKDRTKIEDMFMVLTEKMFDNESC